MSERVTVSKDGLDWVAECVAHEWFVYTSDQPLAYELAAGHVCMEHPKPAPRGVWLEPHPGDGPEYHAERVFWLESPRGGVA